MADDDLCGSGGASAACVTKRHQAWPGVKNDGAAFPRRKRARDKSIQADT